MNRADPVPPRAQADQRRRRSAPTITGLTIVSENPVYIQGNWNTPDHLRRQRCPCGDAVIADAVTVLSNAWTDNNSLEFPYAAASRARARRQLLPGRHHRRQGPIFPKPSDVAADRLRHRRRRPQLPADARGRRQQDGQLPRIDGDILLQPAGGRHLQVLRDASTARRHEISTSTPTSSIRRCCRRTRRCSAT